MIACPVCDTIRPYKLGDGRFKCRACGTRFSWTSAWDSVRLEAATKHRLTEMFVLGVPIYRLRHRKDASAPTKERYYRLLRACCALAEGLAVPLRLGTDGQLLLRISEAGGKIALSVVAPPAPGQGGLIGGPTRNGRPWFIDPHLALVQLTLKGEHVLLGGNGEGGVPGGGGFSNPVISAFWSQAKKGMESLRGMRLRYFHLHLGEACYRYNHRDADLKPLLLGLMRTYTIREINHVIGETKAPRTAPGPLEPAPAAALSAMAEPKAASDQEVESDLQVASHQEVAPDLEGLPRSQTASWAGATLSLETDYAAD
jgi:transposase